MGDNILDEKMLLLQEVALMYTEAHDIAMERKQALRAEFDSFTIVSKPLEEKVLKVDQSIKKLLYQPRRIETLQERGNKLNGAQRRELNELIRSLEKRGALVETSKKLWNELHNMRKTQKSIMLEMRDHNRVKSMESHNLQTGEDQLLADRSFLVEYLAKYGKLEEGDIRQGDTAGNGQESVDAATSLNE